MSGRPAKARNSQFTLGDSPATLAAEGQDISADCIDAQASPALFSGDPMAAGHDVTLDPAWQGAIQGMGVDNSLLP